MNTIRFRYGLWATLLLLVPTAATMLLLGTSLPYATAEAVGYATILLSLTMVFFGIRAHRDGERGGFITFGEAFRTGLAITLIPSLAYFLYNVGFFALRGAEFWDYTDQQMRQSLPAAEYLRYQRDFRVHEALYRNPFVQGAILAATVLVAGAVVALLSALVLRRRPAPSAAGVTNAT